jgi:hypothetical protein
VIGPISLDSMLARRDGASALTNAGYPTKSSTLSQAAHRGDGPVYVVYNNHCLYRWEDLLLWARQRAKRREPGAPSVIPRRLPIHWKSQLATDKREADAIKSDGSAKAGQSEATEAGGVKAA